MIDVGSFHGQVARRIKGVALFLWWFIGCFTHCQEVWEKKPDASGYTWGSNYVSFSEFLAPHQSRSILKFPPQLSHVLQ